MIKCHFIDVFKTFHPDELDVFRNYIGSPFFNKRKKLVDLYDIIRLYYPFFTEYNFTREKVFSKLYPGEKYNYGKINEGFSSLYKLALNYIRQISFEKNEVYPDITFLEELRKRSLKNIFGLTSKKINSEINRFNNIDSNLFLKQYLVEIENANFTILFGKRKNKENIESYISRLTKIMTSMTNFYISELISISVNNFNYSKAYSKDADNIFTKFHKSDILPTLFSIISPFTPYSSYLNLLNYYFEAIYDLGEKKKYYVYKQKVFECIDQMSVDDIGYHLSCLKSYCLIKKKNNHDVEEFSKEYLALQETILARKLFVNSKSEFFVKEQFFNLLGNYDDIKNKNKIKALLGYIKYLPPDNRDEMKYLTEAHLHFLNFSYEKVFSTLKKINVENKTFEERIYNLKIRSLYEMGCFVECMEKINLYKKQHRANKVLSKKRIESELLFLNTLEKLIKIKEKMSNFDAEYLKSKIEKDEFIPSKEWLIEKCYELYDKSKQAYQY